MKDRAWKVPGFAVVGLMALWMGTVSAQAANPAPSFSTGSSVAGIGTAMDQYQAGLGEEAKEASASLTQEKIRFGTFRSMFDDLGVAMVEGSLNIRKEPKSDAAIIGKMDRHAGCDVLGEEHGWYKIRSGPVTGYVYGKYLAVGQAARAMAYYDMKLMVRVDIDTLRVRSGPGTDTSVIGRIHEGETFDLTGIAGGGWVKIRYGDETGYTYVPGYATAAYTIPEAVKIEESLRQKVVNYAVQFVGNRYQWGGTDPHTGADCSGFVQYVMSHAAGISIDRTSRAQASDGYAVSSSEMQPGDLLFYSSGSVINHVAMYIGDGKIVHAANSRSGIKISTWNYRQPVTIRRVIR